MKVDRRSVLKMMGAIPIVGFSFNQRDDDLNRWYIVMNLKGELIEFQYIPLGNHRSSPDYSEFQISPKPNSPLVTKNGVKRFHPKDISPDFAESIFDHYRKNRKFLNSEKWVSMAKKSYRKRRACA